jgi:hypothetical protein
MQGSGTLMQGEHWMILGRVAILSLLMIGGIVATLWASQQDAAVMTSESANQRISEYGDG